ncbi:6939_t:CDS:1, partial [Cetraspora pellucida]
MQSEIDPLRQRISELETEKAELEAKNTKLIKQVTEENAKREAENTELKARIAKLEQIVEENTELKDRITKLEQKQEASPTKDISPLTESHSPEIEHSSTQSETSIASLPQDVIHDHAAEILDFVETIHKERISSETRE